MTLSWFVIFYFCVCWPGNYYLQNNPKIGALKYFDPMKIIIKNNNILPSEIKGLSK